MTQYQRRKALSLAYGQHVNDWRRWRYLGWVAAAGERRARAHAEWLAGAPERALRAREYDEAIAELRADLAGGQRYWPDKRLLWAEGLRAWADAGWVGVVSEARSGSAIVCRWSDFGDSWIE